MGFWCGWCIDLEGVIEHPRKTRKAVQNAFFGDTIRGYEEFLGYDETGDQGTEIRFDEWMPGGVEWKDQARKIAEAVVTAEGKTYEELPMEVTIHFYDTNHDVWYWFPEETEEEAVTDDQPGKNGATEPGLTEEGFFGSLKKLRTKEEEYHSLDEEDE